MRVTRGFGALAHGRGRRVAMAGALAGAAALAVGLGAMASGPEDGSHRTSPRAEVAAAPPTVAPASSTPSTTARPAEPAPRTSVPPTAPSARAAVFGDTGDTGDEFGEYDEYGEDEYDEDEYDEYDEYGESPGCDEGPAPVSPLADGRHLVLLRGVDVEAATVELTEFGLVEGPLHVMHVSAGLDLTGLVGLPPPSSFTATVEGGLVTLLEPF